MEKKNEIGEVNLLDTVNTVSYDPFADESPWISIPGGHYKLMVGEQDYIYLKQVKTGLFKVGYLTFETESHVEKILSTQLLPLTNAMDMAEKKAERLKQDLGLQNLPWYQKPATIKQLDLLKSLGIVDQLDGITLGAAKVLIEDSNAAREAIPATPSQLFKLKDLGIENLYNLSKQSAYLLIKEAEDWENKRL